MQMWSRKARLVRPALVVIMVLALTAILTTACGAVGLDEVRLDSGPVQGACEQVDGQEIWTFKGIPYAAPPVGELRWQAPQPAEPWEAPRVCTEFGSACPQPGVLPGSSLSVGDTDEDCLYLNVWSPAQSQKEGLPVMVWIHGGSLETGSGSMGLYDGSHLATEGVLVVTINYRLGPLGFLSHAALSAEAASGVSGNYGLMDQIAALEWVQRNIAAFGGDPENVTVFGESAGAISILDLIVSPPAEGLFQRAIVESGVLMDQGFGIEMVADQEQAEAVGDALAAELGIDPDGDVAAQMRDKTAQEILNAGVELAGGSESVWRILFWKPVIDGYVLPDRPTALWLSGRFEPMSLLVGSNSDEAELFMPGLVVDEQGYQDLVREVFGDHAEETLSLYPGTGILGPTRALSRTLTEVGFASSARFAARQMSSTGASVYLYEFTQAPLPLMGAFHAVELPYVFGSLGQFSWAPTVDQGDEDLSSAVRGYWARFAATGDPNGDDAPIWPAYEEDSDVHLRLGVTIGPASGLYRDACDLADVVRSGM